MDPRDFRKVLGHYPTGVCVVSSATRSGSPVGMAIGSFTSVSLDPPLVAFFPDRRSSTWAEIRAAGRFCVNVLGDRQEHLSRRFAAPGADRFAGLAHRRSALGLPILDDVAAWLDCRMYAVHEAGDHDIAVGEVVGMEASAATPPLLFHCGGYGRVAPIVDAGLRPA